MEGLRCPHKGLIGPWSHGYPEMATPGPQIGFLQECLRWWDHWLKGIDTGMMDEPALRSWICDVYRPSASHAEWPGHWVADPSWPSPHTRPATLYLSSGTLDASPGEAGTRSIR
jgi:predicted acyl esterase